MPTIFVPNSKGYARNFVHFSWINNVFYFLIIRFRLNFYLHSCNNFPRSTNILYIFAARKMVGSQKFYFRFHFSFFLSRKTLHRIPWKKKGRRISTTESLRCARNSDREASHKSFRCFLFPRPLVEGVVNLAKSPIIQNHSKISWTK